MNLSTLLACIFVPIAADWWWLSWCSLRLGEVFRSVTPSFLRKEEAKNRQNSPDVPEPACLAWQEVQAMRVGFSQVGQAVWVRMRMSSWPHAAHKSRGAKESQAPFWKHKWVLKFRCIFRAFSWSVQIQAGYLAFAWFLIFVCIFFLRSWKAKLSNASLSCD